jgi:hypothetical protein
LFLSTALALFRLTESLVVCYAVEILWYHLSYSNLKRLDRAKAIFLRRALQILKFAITGIVYLLARAQYFIDDLRIAQSSEH